MSSWTCGDCDYENEAEDTVCAACEMPRPVAAAAADAEDDEYHCFRVGAIIECEDAPNTKLKRLKVNVGDAGAPLPIVTAATNVKVGDRIVVACVGATVKGETVAKTTVKGFPSQGMVCDSVMLGWTGGGAGAAVVLPSSCEIGSRPPHQRPRGDAA